MFCEYCGAENPDDATFCRGCGKRLNAMQAKNEKNMITALIISFILPGLGVAYAGNLKTGIALFIVGMICHVIGLGVPLFRVFAIIVWAVALYLTYVEVENANGNENPNIKEDFKGLSTGNKIGVLILVLIIALALSGSVMAALSPHHDTSSNVNHDYSPSPSSSSDLGSSSSSSSSGSSERYSSSSNGRDVESHYEGEYGSADTHGTVYDDGSVESHQTGHTDYGDYKVDSYMDSNGNLHGTVDMGGRTYYVDY